MNANIEQRKLAAIMFTDMVGCSAMRRKKFWISSRLWLSTTRALQAHFTILVLA
jgi:hypothetical protein